MKRVALSLNGPERVRDALDLRVREGRAKGFPVERASLAAHLLATALRVDGVKLDEGKAFFRATVGLLGELRPMVPALRERVAANLRAEGFAEDAVVRFLGLLELEDE